MWWSSRNVPPRFVDGTLLRFRCYHASLWRVSDAQPGAGENIRWISSRFLLVVDISSEKSDRFWEQNSPLEETKSIYKPMRNSHESLDSDVSFEGLRRAKAVYTLKLFISISAMITTEPITGRCQRLELLDWYLALHYYLGWVLAHWHSHFLW